MTDQEINKRIAELKGWVALEIKDNRVFGRNPFTEVQGYKITYPTPSWASHMCEALKLWDELKETFYASVYLETSGWAVEVYEHEFTGFETTLVDALTVSQIAPAMCVIWIKAKEHVSDD